ncbi:MAG TPA: glycosyltransferase family 2 protein [Candidatus Ozemobacteraceae bacterium]|nr:glycosyltransferase family 2 protein [Candidatus Ozemobacteraceae bacterium]
MNTTPPSPRILICLPAYNEEARLPITLRSLFDKLPNGTDVVVIDDGSTDGTVSVAKHERARCISLPINLGYGGALQTGYKLALREGYDILVQMDADGQHDPASLPALLSPLLADEADFVIGNRFHDGCAYESPVVRDIGRRFFAFLCRLLTGMPLKDPTSGFKALNRAVLGKLVQDGFPMDYPDADVFIMLHLAGIRICEVNVIMHKALPGLSMHGGLFHPVWYTAKMLLSIVMTLLRHLGGPNV